VIKRALAAADAAKIETQHREAAMGKRIVALVDDLVIHRAVKLRMRMQDHRDRRVLLLGRVIAAFETARGAGENNFRHGRSSGEFDRFVAGLIGASADKTSRRKSGAGVSSAPSRDDDW
jgi:hypothetical protein